MTARSPFTWRVRPWKNHRPRKTHSQRSSKSTNTEERCPFARVSPPSHGVDTLSTQTLFDAYAFFLARLSAHTVSDTHVLSTYTSPFENVHRVGCTNRSVGADEGVKGIAMERVGRSSVSHGGADLLRSPL